MCGPAVWAIPTSARVQKSRQCTPSPRRLHHNVKTCKGIQSKSLTDFAPNLTSVADHVKTLPLGFLSALLDETHFQQWIRLSIGTRSESWFHHLFEDTLTAGDIQQFDEVCQKMQDKLFELATNAVLKRTNENQSFEFDLHEYHRSQEFSKLCVELPGRLADHHAGCVMLFMSLSRMFSTWLKDALVHARKKRNPELFRRRTNTLLSNVEENNETHRFAGWAIFSSMK